MKDLAIFIQARMGSSRLPGKVLLPLGSFNSLSLMAARLVQNFDINKVSFLIPTGAENASLKNFLMERKFNFFEGSEDDVFQRFQGALGALFPMPNIFVRLTGDCPLIEPSYLDSAIKIFVEGNYEYLKTSSRIPEGLDFEIIKTEVFTSLKEANLTELERMHASYHFSQNRSKFRTYEFDLGQDFSNYRVTLDEEKDYEVLESIVCHFGSEITTTSWTEIKNFLDSNPQIKLKNQEVIRNQGLLLDKTRLKK